MKEYLSLLALMMLGMSGAAQARECKFYAGTDDVLIMSPGTQPVITPLPVGTIDHPNADQHHNPDGDNTDIKSHCSGGDDGADVYQLTDNAMLSGEIDGKATFSTNIPGIVYTLAFTRMAMA